MPKSARGSSLADKAPSKGSVFAAVLYPDNAAQMEWLTAMYAHPDPEGIEWMVHIRHEPEPSPDDETEKKPHFHVMWKYYGKARSARSVVKSTCAIDVVWRLAHMRVKADVSERLRKRRHEEPETETGYIRETTWIDKEHFVLSDPDDPSSYIEQPYKDGEKLCRSPCKLDEVWRLTPIYTVPYVVPISNVFSYAQYMLHATYRCHKDGKRPYCIDDVQGSRQIVNQYFIASNADQDKRIFDELMYFTVDCYSERRLLNTLQSYGRYDLIRYVSTHTSFVKMMIGSPPMMHSFPEDDDEVDF